MSHRASIMCGSDWQRSGSSRSTSARSLHLRDVVLVDVDQVLVDGALGARHVRLDVDRVHVGVPVEREREAPDRRRAVAEGEVVAERLRCWNSMPMRSSSVRVPSTRHELPSNRETQGMTFVPDAFSAGVRIWSLWRIVPSKDAHVASRIAPQAPPRHM